MNKQKQSGMSLVGFIVVLGVVGVFIYMGMKVIPMYSQYASVKKALDGLARESGMSDNPPEKIKDLFFRRIDVDYVDAVKPENVKIKRKDAGWLMTVEYEARRPLIANLDIVGRFNAEREIKRGAE